MWCFLIFTWLNYMLKPSRRFSRLLVMMPRVKLVSKSGTTALNIPASLWKARHAQAGHPHREVIERFQHIVMEDNCVTIQEITHKVGISTGSVHSILSLNLCMWRASTKFAHLFCPNNPSFPSQEQHTTLTDSLLSWLGTMWLLALPQ